MSENYQPDVKLDENPNGTVSFATEVVATIAGLAATEVEGVARMSSQNTGIADKLTRKNARNFTKGVRIDLEGNKVTVDVTIVVEYGSPVPDVAHNIQENVKKAIETMSGLDVHAVDVHVSGISFEREQRATAELDEQRRKMLEESQKAAEEAQKAAEAAAAAKAAEEAAKQAAEEAARAEEEARIQAEVDAEFEAEAAKAAEEDEDPEEAVEEE